MDYEADEREQIFHNTVRENIIFLLLFVLLYIVSYTIIGQVRRRDREYYYTATPDDDDVTVYNISVWLCSFSLSVSILSALLLPLSIISNEVLILYSNSYYVKWLNSSLIQGLWNQVFLFSNLSLFILLPFSYLFMESEGFPGSRKGLWARVQETFIVLTLVAFLVFGMAYILSALFDSDKSNVDDIMNSYYLRFLYSCVSFMGVLMLLLCTPLGFVRLFTVVGQFLVKPQFLRDLDEEYNVIVMERECLKRRLEHAKQTGKTYLSPPPMSTTLDCNNISDDDLVTNSQGRNKLLSLQNGALQMGLTEMLAEVEDKCRLLDKQRRTSAIQRNVMYPFCILLLFALTVIAVLFVLQNTLALLIGIRALPLSTKQFTLGVSSLSKLGPLGAALEIVLIIYLQATSTVGVYTLPLLSDITPKLQLTPLSHIIANCVLLLILNSALPLLTRILGITNFDLMGDFGRIEWLGNFKIVLMYNLLFAGASTLCLMNKFTATVRRELYNRLRSLAVFVLNGSYKQQSPSHSYKQD